MHMACAPAQHIARPTHQHPCPGSPITLLTTRLLRTQLLIESNTMTCKQSSYALRMRILVTETVLLEGMRTCTMPVVFLQAGQWNWFFFRFATAKRPQRSHTCTLYASLWSNSRSCNTQHRLQVVTLLANATCCSKQYAPRSLWSVTWAACAQRDEDRCSRLLHKDTKRKSGMGWPKKEV